jgi:alginate O-acetyltransferase complex protein AlgI
MLFPTVEFAIFFALVFPISWALNRANGAKKFFLTLVSYVFYSFWDWRFLFLLLFSSVFNFAFGLALGVSQGRRARKLAVTLAIAGNLALLGYFKYYDFLAAHLGALLARFGAHVDLGSTGLALPIAISFLTFHGLSYVIDVYRGVLRPSRSLIDLMLYISFFPHLVAGPIVRARDFLAQLSRPSDPARIALGQSLLLILGGLVKKVVIASHISTRFVDPVFVNPPDFGSLDLVLAMYAYAIVIYCDFSAYTDIAIGVANLLGYRFPQNFNQPYRALSLQDFWRRWHMTLSSWLRDYLYVPLGGNRFGAPMTYRNLMLTMGLGGLWHGAGLQFIVWGLMHGAGLSIERLLGVGAASAGGVLPRALRWFVTFNFVCVAWIFFRSQSFDAALGYFRAIGAPAPAPAIVSSFVLALMALGLATQFLPEGWFTRLELAYERAPLPVQIIAPAFVIWIVSVLAPAGVPPFIYFQF